MSITMRPSTYEWDSIHMLNRDRQHFFHSKRLSSSRNVSFSIPHIPMSPLQSPLPLPIPSPLPDIWNYSSSAPSSPVHGPFTMMEQQRNIQQHQHITGPHVSYQELQIYPHLTYEEQQNKHEQHHHHSSQAPSHTQIKVEYSHPPSMIYHPPSASHPQIKVEYIHDETHPSPAPSPSSIPHVHIHPPSFNPHTAISHPSPSSSNASTPKPHKTTSTPQRNNNNNNNINHNNHYNNNQNNKRKTISPNTTKSASASTSRTPSPAPKRIRGRGKELELVDGQMVHLGQRRSRYARLLERMNAELMACKSTLEQQKQRIHQLEEQKKLCCFCTNQHSSTCLTDTN